MITLYSLVTFYYRTKLAQYYWLFSPCCLLLPRDLFYHGSLLPLISRHLFRTSPHHPTTNQFVLGICKSVPVLFAHLCSDSREKGPCSPDCILVPPSKIVCQRFISSLPKISKNTFMLLTSGSLGISRPIASIFMPLLSSQLLWFTRVCFYAIIVPSYHYKQNCPSTAFPLKEYVCTCI